MALAVNRNAAYHLHLRFEPKEDKDRTYIDIIEQELHHTLVTIARMLRQFDGLDKRDRPCKIPD
jgi:hypothetical protein